MFTCSNTVWPDIPHTHFSITLCLKLAEHISAKKAIVISQQSTAALHLQNVIKILDMSFNKDKRGISEMEISLSFSLSQGEQRVHTFWEKTTLILMHRLATCQDRVSSFHQALSSKHSSSDVLEDCDWDCVSTANHLISLFCVFFLFWAYSTIFSAYQQRYFCISSLNKPQQGTAINQQVHWAVKLKPQMSSPFKHRVSWYELTNHNSFKRFVFVLQFKRKEILWCELRNYSTQVLKRKRFKHATLTKAQYACFFFLFHPLPSFMWTLSWLKLDGKYHVLLF